MRGRAQSGNLKFFYFSINMVVILYKFTSGPLHCIHHSMEVVLHDVSPHIGREGEGLEAVGEHGVAVRLREGEEGVAEVCGDGRHAYHHRSHRSRRRAHCGAGGHGRCCWPLLMACRCHVLLAPLIITNESVREQWAGKG